MPRPGARSAAGCPLRPGRRVQRSPQVDRPAPVPGLLELDPDRRAAPGDRREPFEHRDLDARRLVGRDPRPALELTIAMVHHLAREVVGDPGQEPLGRHRDAVRGRGRHGRQGDPPSAFTAGPLLGRPPLAERARDLEGPALVDDRDRPPAIADQRALLIDARDALGHPLGHRVADAAQLDQLGPLPPRIGERGIAGQGASKQAEGLVHRGSLEVVGRWAPADLRPQQDQGPLEQVAGVGRVQPPRPDVGRDPGVLDRLDEPGIVARPDRRGNGALERELGARAGADLERGCAAAPELDRAGDRPAQQGEVRPLHAGPLGERGPRTHPGGRGIDGSGLVLPGPLDPQLALESLEDPGDERVVAGAHGRRVGGRHHAALGIGGDRDRLGRRMHVEQELGALDRALDPGRPDVAGILAVDPVTGVGQQAIGRRQPRDQAAPRCLADDSDREPQSEPPPRSPPPTLTRSRRSGDPRRPGVGTGAARPTVPSEVVRGRPGTAAAAGARSRIVGPWSRLAGPPAASTSTGTAS